MRALRLVVHIAKGEDFPDPALVVARKPAGGRKVVGLLKGAKQAVPPRNIAVMVAVHAELVMDGMVLGPLHEIAQPPGGGDVGVIKVFARGAE